MREPPVPEHDHDLDLVLMCGTCGLVMAADPEEAVVRRLVRYVAPRMTMTSDNLTSVEPTRLTFDVREERL